MEFYTEAGIALAVGLAVGYLAGVLRGRFFRDNDEGAIDWWERRRELTGTQLQILQYLESNREASINELQEKFEYIPDRELYYRLEQIYLMGFLLRERRGGQVMYVLNPEYSGTVEGDNTLMLEKDKDEGSGKKD